MAKFTVACPKCRATLRASSSDIGKDGACFRCGARFPIGPPLTIAMVVGETKSPGKTGRRDKPASNLGRAVGISAVRSLHHLKGHSSQVHSAIFSPDGEFVQSGGKGGTLRTWDVATGQCVRSLGAHAGHVNALAASCDGRFLLTGGSDGLVKQWGAESGRCKRTMKATSGCINAVAISPDGELALSGSHSQQSIIAHEKTLRLWDLKTGKSIWKYERQWSNVNAVAFSPDGRMALSASEDKTLRLWEIESGDCLRTMEGHKSPINAACFSPSGRLVLTASGDDLPGGAADNSLRLWEVATGRLLQSYDGHAGSVKSVAFSPDGRMILSGGEDNLIRLWDVWSGRCLQTIEWHNACVNAVAFAPDGRHFLSAASDKSIRLGEIDWEHESATPADWDERVTPFLEQFLTLHTPMSAELARVGAPAFTDDDFDSLLVQLLHAGFGWLHAHSVRVVLEGMAADWKEPPPLRVGGSTESGVASSAENSTIRCSRCGLQLDRPQLKKFDRVKCPECGTMIELSSRAKAK